MVGRQVRYLISSAHGCLGAIGFAAPALQLADRDRWIGWDAEQRRAHLHSVVCLSRFLSRPSVDCRNLASRLLSMSLDRMVEDLPQTRLINVCDREADFFELFEEQRRNPCVDLLVRANHNRNITDEPFKLFDAIRQAPVQTTVRVHVPRQSARQKLSKKKARPKRPSRQADLSVRSKAETLDQSAAQLLN